MSRRRCRLNPLGRRTAGSRSLKSKQLEEQGFPPPGTQARKRVILGAFNGGGFEGRQAGGKVAAGCPEEDAAQRSRQEGVLGLRKLPPNAGLPFSILPLGPQV